jgi:hypothetical protein
VIWYEYRYEEVELTPLDGRKAPVRNSAKNAAKTTRLTALENRFIAPPEFVFL